ncbi:MAG: glutamate--tRNA ligase [Helicobacter sp.]|nr:glutamate--tRNA ligase [Helicobacter sp.]
MIITRFAPSPTGNLHIGGLRTALFNYLYARSRGGKFLLRIEDTDFARNSVDAKDGILRAFDWLGLDYDGTIEYQSKRLEIYKQHIQKLLDSKAAYYCYMSKDELEALREEQRARGETPRYNRKYRDFTGTPPAGIAPVVRLKAPLSGEIVIEDGIKGKVSIQATEIDDFIIARSDGTPIYNFSAVVDDALMGVTDVIRGDDHLSNTPKQILLYKALGFPVPRFFHIPMICNEAGKKLSKRDGAMGVMDYAQAGYLPEALLNFLVRLGWSHGDEEIFSRQTLLQLFDVKDINTAPSAYNASKLLWLNHHYLNAQSNDSLRALLEPFGVSIAPNIAAILFPALKERCKTLVEMKEQYLEIMNPPVYDAKLFAKNANQGALDTLAQSLAILQDLAFEDAQTLEESFARNIAPHKPFLLLRLALLGKGGGVPIFVAMLALGKDESLRRIAALQGAIAAHLGGG